MKAYNLKDYIESHLGSQRAFAKSIGKPPQHVTKMINRGDVVVVSECWNKPWLYSARMELPEINEEMKGE